MLILQRFSLILTSQSLNACLCLLSAFPPGKVQVSGCRKRKWILFSGVQLLWLATLLRPVQDQCMCASVPNRGKGNQRRPGLVFCVFIGKRAGQNRRAEEKFMASATPSGNSCLSVHVPKKRGLTFITL